MNLDILEKKMPEAIKYASNIITETPNFIEFAIALTDYMGKDFIPYCKSVYMMLVNLSEFSHIAFNYEDFKHITPSIIEAKYNAFISKQQEKQRELEFGRFNKQVQFQRRELKNSDLGVLDTVQNFV